jgi:hypothetical protein
MSSHVFKIATQEPAALLEAITAALGEDSRIARQVREQMPKPKPSEPSGDFIVVPTDVWPPFRKVGEGAFWTNQDDYQFDTWDELADYFPRSEFVVYRPEGSGLVRSLGITDDMVEAAASAIGDRYGHPPDDYRTDARAALDAALRVGPGRSEAEVKTEALTEAAAAARQEAADSRTNNGRSESEGLADWLDEYAKTVAS